MKDIFEFLLFLKEQWEKELTGILISISIWIAFFLRIEKYINYGGEKWIEIIPSSIPIRNNFYLFILLNASFLLFWFLSRKVKKAKKGYIGIAIAIRTESQRAKTTIKRQFVDAIKRELESKGNFSIVVLSEYHTQRLLNQFRHASKYSKKTKCNLIAFGYIEIVTHSGAEHYDIHLDAHLSHSPIPKQESLLLSKEMRFSLPQDQLFPCTEEFFGFKFSTQLFSVMARYILGIGAHYSQQNEIAIKLHQGILQETITLAREKNDFPIYRRIRDVSKQFVIQEAILLSQYYYNNNRNYEKMNENLKIIKYYEPTNYSGCLIASILLFRRDRDVKGSFEELKTASRNKRDFTWAYNKAFLYAYIGDLKNAYSLYENAFYKPADKTAHLQSISFIKEILDEEPDKVQLYYCIGLIEFKKANDREKAKKAFSRFVLEAKSKSLFSEHVYWAEKYLERCP